MSTRMSVYYEEDGIHIYRELASDHPGLFLEFSQGAFTVEIPLSEKFSDIVANRNRGAELETENARLRQALADAPHEYHCITLCKCGNDHSTGCNCWKAALTRIPEAPK